MSFDLGFFSGAPNRKGCKECTENPQNPVLMDATQVWHPGLAAFVDAWECPECGRQVMREEGDDVGMTTPDGDRL